MYYKETVTGPPHLTIPEAKDAGFSVATFQEVVTLRLAGMLEQDITTYTGTIIHPSGERSIIDRPELIGQHTSPVLGTYFKAPTTQQGRTFEMNDKYSWQRQRRITSLEEGIQDPILAALIPDEQVRERYVKESLQKHPIIIDTIYHPEKKLTEPILTLWKASANNILRDYHDVTDKKATIALIKQ